MAPGAAASSAALVHGSFKGIRVTRRGVSPRIMAARGRRLARRDHRPTARRCARGSACSTRGRTSRRSAARRRPADRRRPAPAARRSPPRSFAFRLARGAVGVLRGTVIGGAVAPAYGPGARAAGAGPTSARVHASAPRRVPLRATAPAPTASSFDGAAGPVDPALSPCRRARRSRRRRPASRSPSRSKVTSKTHWAPPGMSVDFLDLRRARGPWTGSGTGAGKRTLLRP